MQPACDRVLVIEDDALLRGVLRDALEHAGYEVIEAGSAEEGLALAGAEPRPLVVITDLRFEGRRLDGIDLGALLRDQAGTRDLGIIAMSGLVEPDWSTARHFDAYLRKPIDLELLLDLISRLVDAARAPWRRTVEAR